MFKTFRPLVAGIALITIASSAVAVPRTMLFEKFSNTG